MIIPLGTQFFSKQYPHLFYKNNIKGSMSKKATPNDTMLLLKAFCLFKKRMRLL